MAQFTFLPWSMFNPLWENPGFFSPSVHKASQAAVSSFYLDQTHKSDTTTTNHDSTTCEQNGQKQGTDWDQLSTIF